MASSGKAQVNTWLPDAYVEWPFIDCARQVDRFWDCIGATSDFVELIGSNNYPTAMAGGSGVYTLSLVLYFTNNDPWVCTWDGAATTAFSLSISTSGVLAPRTVVNANRHEFTITSATRPMGSNFRCTPTFTAIGAGFSNFRIFRKSQEALLNAGKKFNPEWTALYKGIGRLRFMDWLHTNLNPIMTWANRTTEAMPFWEGHNLVTGSYCGVCTNSEFTASTSLDQAALVIGNQTTMTTAAHTPLTVGRSIFLYSRAAPNKNFEAGVVSDDGTTLVLKIIARTTDGGGVKADWNVSQTNTLTALHGPNGNPTKNTWTHGDLVTARLPCWSNYRVLTTITRGANTTFGLPAHGYVNGDKLMFAMNDSSLSPTVNFQNQTDGRVFTCSVIDADHFQVVEGLASTSWPSPAGGSVIKAVMFNAGSLPPKPLVNYGLSSVGHIDVQTFPGCIWNLYYDAQSDALKATILGGSTISGSPTPWRFGMPFETLIDAANELNVNPWFCIPTCADVDFMTQLATLVFTRLNTDLEATFEFSNEVWNIGILVPTGYCATKGRQLLAGPPYGADAMSSFYGLQVYNMTNAVKAVFAGQTNRVNCVLAQQITGAYSQAGNKPRYQAPFAGLPAGVYPVGVADSVAFAPYIECDRRTIANAAMVYANKINRLDPTAMAWADNVIRTNNGNTRANFTLNYCNNVAFPNFRALINAPAPGVGPKRMTMYEGGYGMVPSVDNITDKVQSITWTAGVATVTTVNPHGRTGTFNGFIQNAPQNDATPAYNIGATIAPFTTVMTVTGPNTFTYPLASNPGYVSSIGDWGPCTFYNGNALLTDGFAITAAGAGATYAGKVAFRLTASAGSIAEMVDGQSYWIDHMYGATGANGLWPIALITSTTFDLVGSVYAPGFIAGNSSGVVLSDRDNFFNDIYRSTQFGQVLAEYLQGFVDAGGEYPSQYTMIGAWGAGTMWGAIQPGMYAGAAFGDVTPAYAALRAFNDAGYALGRYALSGMAAVLTKSTALVSQAIVHLRHRRV